jgi:hypothetical protein
MAKAKRKQTRNAVQVPIPQMTGSMGPQAYNSVVAAARLSGIYLVSAKFDVEAHFFEDSSSHDLEFGGEVHACEFDEQSTNAMGFFDWWVQAMAGDKVVLRFAARYAARYDGFNGKDTRAVRAFVERVGRFATYPYFRALAAQMSWESAAGLPPMPILREDTLATARKTPSVPPPALAEASQK